MLLHKVPYRQTTSLWSHLWSLSMRLGNMDSDQEQYQQTWLLVINQQNDDIKNSKA
jgi:hypothetical protein